MIRSILLPLDGSPSSQRAMEFAINTIHTLQRDQSSPQPVVLTGIAVVDVPTISSPQAVPIGGAAFKKHRDEYLLADAAVKTRQFLDDFQTRCQQANVRSDVIHAQGLPYTEIEHACQTHDLIVVGKDSNFHFETSNEKDDTVIQLLRDHPRPLIAVDSQIPEEGEILVAFDGSQPASRTLHLFLMMQLQRLGSRVHVVSVDYYNIVDAEKLCEAAKGLLRQHGVDPILHPVQSRKHVSEILLKKVEELNIRLVVMGSFGHTGMQTWFFGSATREMFDRCSVPMFLYH